MMSYKSILSNLVREVILETQPSQPEQPQPAADQESGSEDTTSSPPPTEEPPPPPQENPAEKFAGQEAVSLTNLAGYAQYFKQWKRALAADIEEYERKMAVLSGEKDTDAAQSVVQEAVDVDVKNALTALDGMIAFLEEFIEFMQDVRSLARQGIKKFQQQKGKRAPQTTPDGGEVEDVPFRLSNILQELKVDKNTFNEMWIKIPAKDKEQALISLSETAKPLPASVLYIITIMIGKANPEFAENKLYKVFTTTPAKADATLRATQKQLAKYSTATNKKTKANRIPKLLFELILISL